MLSRLCWAIVVVSVLGLAAPAMAQNQQQGGAGEAKQNTYIDRCRSKERSGSVNSAKSNRPGRCQRGQGDAGAE